MRGVGAGPVVSRRLKYWRFFRNSWETTELALSPLSIPQTSWPTLLLVPWMLPILPDPSVIVVIWMEGTPRTSSGKHYDPRAHLTTGGLKNVIVSSWGVWCLLLVLLFQSH